MGEPDSSRADANLSIAQIVQSITYYTSGNRGYR